MRFIFPFSIDSIFSFFNINAFTNISIGNIGLEYVPSDIGFAKTPVIDVGIISVNNAVNYFLPSANIYGSINPMQILIFSVAVVWIVGMLIIFGYEVFLFFRTKILVRKAVFYKDNIYECDNIPTPFVMGLIKPKIYIPFRLKEPEISYILCHEKYYIKRYDNIVKIIASVIVFVYWFNPFV